MALVKEIMGQSMVEASYFDALTASPHLKTQKLKKIVLSLSPTVSSSVKTLQELKKVVVQPTAPVPVPAPCTVDESKRALNRKPAMVTVTGTVTLKNSRDRVEEMMEMVLPGFDAFNVNRRGGAIVMQLVSTEVDPKTMEAKLSKQAVLHLSKDSIIGIQESTYRVEFEMDSDFGMPGAITVRNKYDKEVFLESIDIEDFVHFSCNSWVQPDMVHPEKRFFFSNKACLPCQTPLGLKEPREEDLRQLRGEDQKGVRKFGDRVYDYDLYNDLGNPDDGNEHARPILGTKRYPHPLRCRTGRPSTITELKAESRVKEFAQTYVPRDEAFRGVRKEALDQEMFKSMTRNLIPFIKTHASKYGAFKHLSEITSIYKGKSEMKSKEEGKLGNTTKLPLPMDLIKLKDSAEEYFKFNIPNIITRVDCCGIGDEEFGRQILAGVNPLSIKRLETFPPMSQLDPFIYGPQESSLREEHIIPHLEGMSIHQAMAKKKLFVLDYHDTFLPFLKGMNALEDRKAYATRTIFFLTKAETLKPIAIELSLPQGYQDRPAKQVLTPPVDATSRWLWQLGKAHVCSNDAGVHQLVHHWLRTHACMEPFIIAAHRQLSAMHPIFKLLKPHMKHTLQINAMAREALINGEGIIESDFSVGRYSTEILSAAYRDWWRFDMESLPADLVRRGMAEPDPNAAHGLKLLIKDYPYANDGLLIWSALENFVGTYVNYYYHDGPAVQSDTELQAWYHEAIAEGHVNHRDASWWPKLSFPSDLTSILTTLIWISSVQHSAVNFGQYPFGGFVPMRPPLMRKLLPNEKDLEEYKQFLEDPEGYFCSSMPNMFQITKFLAVVNMLSNHSSDEEYLGQRKDLQDWSGDPQIIEAFYGFSMEIKRIEKEIEKRNRDPKLRNRCGAGVPPYELLMASSDPGVTSRGVPNSISI